MTLLDEIRDVAARFEKIGPRLVAFEIGVDVRDWLLKNVKPQKAGSFAEPIRAADSEYASAGRASMLLSNVVIRVVPHLRQDVCIPVFRKRNGEETWGNPLYLPANGEISR